MKKNKWKLFIAIRWFSPGKTSGPSLIPAAVGIAVGVAALLIVIAVMNGFQMGFINAVLELDSFHIQIKMDAKATFFDALNNANKSLATENKTKGSNKNASNIKSAMPYLDIRTVVSSSKGKILPVRIKIIPDNALEMDKSFASEINIRLGAFGGGLCIGSELAKQLNIKVGDAVSLLKVLSDEEEGLSFDMLDFSVSAIYHSGYYEFDSGLAFMDFSSSNSLGSMDGWSVGIKLKDRYSDVSAMAFLQKLGLENLVSWRDYNRSFFGALRMEKTVMMLLIGLIFVVVGVNIFHSMRKTVFNRIEDIASLKAFGGKSIDIKQIFMLDGLVTGLGGAISGLIIGILLSININRILKIIDFFYGLVYHFFGGKGPAFKLFSPAYFYISNVPVSLKPLEVIFITLSGVFSAFFAALAACSRISNIMPSEVLRNE